MAYKFKALADKLQAKGLEVAEEAAKDAYEAFKEWILESAQESENKMDDVVAAVFPVVDATVLGYIDDINPADNESQTDGQG